MPNYQVVKIALIIKVHTLFIAFKFKLTFCLDAKSNKKNQNVAKASAATAIYI